MADTRDFLVGVLIGSAIGAAAALLYAPAPGVETRRRIRETSEEARDRTMELAREAQSRISEARKEAGSKISDLTHQAQEMVDRGRGVIEKQREAVASAVEAGRQAYREKSTELGHEVAQDAAS